jgi:hypothetical protein
VTLRPNIAVTHVSAEFSAPITTNALGYRTTVNQSPTPDLVFLGDSFTFGHGVADEETFVSIACRLTGRACQNLGYSGTSTFEQTNVLRHALSRGLRPKTVAVAMLSACWLDSAGNDLGDNARYLRQHPQALTAPEAATVSAQEPAQIAQAPAPAAATAAPAPAAPAPEVGLLKRLQFMLTEFEIGKRALLVLMAPIKRGVYACSDEAEAARAMPATGSALRALAALGERYGFETVLFVIHPLQELEAAHRTTEARILPQLPAGMRVVFTAGNFRPGHYFPYDGHFNAAGQKAMGELVARELNAP